MIIYREYKPKGDEILYHYCDANAFYSICNNRKLWFNDLFSMNDYMEMHWGYSIWKKAAGTRLKRYGKEFLDEIDSIIHFSGYQGLLLGICFSTDFDVLSQWRAYTNDGFGYVIGFNAKELLGLPIRALKVLYDEEQQIKEAAATIDALYKIKQDDPSKFKIMCGLFGWDLSAFKNPAFAEEKEIRLVHLLDFQKSNNFAKLIDEGGNYYGVERKGEVVRYRMKQNIPTPYIELDFSNGNKLNPIKEVIIGPKNDVRLTAIGVFLETIGIEKVKIKKSNASYR